MGRRKSTDSDGPARSPEMEVYFAIAQAMSNLHHMLAKRSEDVRYLRVTPRPDGTWLAVLAAFSDDGSPIVAFGSGELWVDAMRNLNASIAGGKWKEDKFYK